MSSPGLNHDPNNAQFKVSPQKGGTNISAPFIKRPVATFLLSIAVILAGAVAYKMLPVASLPQVEYPVISVGASLPGADPETMASSVATPLERQFAKIAGINEMTSSSTTGSAQITLQFDLNRDVNGAARDVQAAINAAQSQLPSNLPSNPTYRKINPADSPILILALTSETMTVPQLYDACDSILAQKIAQVNGVGQTVCGGSAKPAVRVEANPTLLAGTGIGLEALRAALSSVNVNQPTGYLQNGTVRRSCQYDRPTVRSSGLCSSDYRDRPRAGKFSGGEQWFAGLGSERRCERWRSRKQSSRAGKYCTDRRSGREPRNCTAARRGKCCQRR